MPRSILTDIDAVKPDNLWEEWYFPTTDIATTVAPAGETRNQLKHHLLQHVLNEFFEEDPLPPNDTDAITRNQAISAFLYQNGLMIDDIMSLSWTDIESATYNDVKNGSGTDRNLNICQKAFLKCYQSMHYWISAQNGTTMNAFMYQVKYSTSVASQYSTQLMHLHLPSYEEQEA